MTKHGSMKPAWGNSLPGIEGLRGIAAASVVVAHTGAEMAAQTTTSGGYWQLVVLFRHGLTLFFVLSGFLLFRQFASAIILDKPWPTFSRFFSNRLWRIFPAYVVVLLFTSLVLQSARLSSAAPEAKAEEAGVLSLVDTLVTLPLLQTLVPDFVRSGLGVAWSLTTELTFYLLLPVLAAMAAWLARRLRSEIAVWTAPAVLLAVGIAGKAVDRWVTADMTAAEAYNWRWGHEWSAVFARSILMHGDLFAFGMAAAIIFVLLERRQVTVPTWVPLTLAGAALLLLLMVNDYAQPWYPYDDSLVAVVSGIIIILVALPVSQGSNWPGRLLDSAPIAWAGQVSYSVYLWHIPLAWFLIQRGWTFGDSAAGFAGNLLLVAALTYAASAVTFNFVEKPGLAMKKRTDKRRKERVGAA